MLRNCRNILKTQYKLPAICCCSTTSDGPGAVTQLIMLLTQRNSGFRMCLHPQPFLTAHPAAPVDLQAPLRSSKPAQTSLLNSAVTMDELIHPITLMGKNPTFCSTEPSLTHPIVLKLQQESLRGPADPGRTWYSLPSPEPLPSFPTTASSLKPASWHQEKREFMRQTFVNHVITTNDDDPKKLNYH